jgi:hypothetical protein
MPVLESKLIIGAKDETGGAFAKIQEHIASLDKKIATFDKLSAAARKVAGANDPMIASIDRGAKSLAEEKTALDALQRAMSLGVGSAEEMSAVQSRLARSTSEATRAMARQGEEAALAARKMKRAREGGVGKALGEALPFAGPGILEGTKKAVESGADLEQMKFRLRAVSGGDKTEAPFAEALAAEVAAKYPAITQAKALDTYLELRGPGGTNKETARRNLMTVSQAQTAALAIGTEITPEDAQNLLKAVEGSGRAGDPTAVGKMFDSFIRAKQVFGSAIDSSKVRDYVQNAKGANFGIGEDQFFWQNIVRMTEGNASRLGNETAQTLQTLVGGHATKQTARWLVDMGLATGFTPQGGGAATIQGLKGSDTLQINQLDWANEVLLPALQAHGVLSEENIKNREALLRKDNPQIDERTARERAEAGLISAAISRSGMRTTVTDNLAHAIANELLINRDVAQMKSASGSADLAARVGQNPVAAMAELTGSLSNFAAVLTNPIMGQASKALSSLGSEIAAATKQFSDFSKVHPDAAKAVSGGAVAGATAGGLWLTGKLFGLVKGWLGLGGGAAAGAVAGGEAGAEAGALGGPLGMAAGAAGGMAIGAALNTPTGRSLVAAVTEKVFGPASAAPKPPEHNWGPWHAGGTPTGPIMPQSWTPSGVSLSGGADNAKLAAAAAMPVTVSGEATVDHEIRVRIEPSPLLQAIVDQARQQSETTIPLIGGGSGRMDSDAGPTRPGGIGSR